MALTWSHAVLYVKDAPRMLDFYTRVLGFEVTDRGMMGNRTSEIIFLSQSPREHHQLAFVPTREDEGPSNTLVHVAFRTGGLAELRGAIEALEGEAVALRPVSHGNTWSVYFQDPEGNGIEIFCETPWFVPQPAGETWDMQIDDDGLLAWTERTFSGREGFTALESYYRQREEELAD